MTCGISESIITPPVGCWLHGYGARDRPSTGVRDDLLASAIVFEEKGRAAAILCADIIAFHPRVVAEIKDRVAKATAIPTDSLMLVASHTHAGPAVSDLRGMGAPDDQYLVKLASTAAGCVVEAFRGRAPAELATHRRAVPGIGFIREGLHAGKPSPDADLVMLSVRRKGSGSLLGVLWSYSCHAVVLGSENYLISADYPGAVRRFVRRRLSIPSLFLQGACGDINPVSRKGDGEAGGGSPPSEEVERLGEVLGSAVDDLAGSARPSSSSSIAAAAGTAKLPTQRPTSEQLDEISRANMGDAAAFGSAGSFLESNQRQITARWVEETRSLLESGAFPESVDCPIQILRIGDAWLIGVGAEPFSRIGMSAREQLGRDSTFFSGYVNGCIGYVPSSESYDVAEYGARVAAQWYGRPVLAKGSDVVLLKAIGDLARAIGREGDSHD